MLQFRSVNKVSTHSRPKAAARGQRRVGLADGGFNTQPPEGGCPLTGFVATPVREFQHTAARRRLPA